MKHTSQRNLSLRKALLSALVVAPLATLPAPVWAALPSTLPANLTSSAGAATTIVELGTTLSITTPDRTVLNWGAYSVDAGDIHSFNLPSATASVLNRVSGGGATAVNGTLASNGRVFILNPNGITVGATGIISTAGLGLSTINEPDFSFASTGALSYVGTATSNVIVNGAAAISVGSTGNVTLAGNTVTFAGTITTGTLDVRALATAGTGVTVGSGAATRVGGDNSTSGGRHGTLNITTSGSGVDLSSGAGVVTVSGGVLNVTTSGGLVEQTGAALLVGTTQATGTVSINTSATTPGVVTLASVAAPGTDRALNLTLNSGAATVANPSSGNLALQASTVNGDLSLTSGLGSITSGGKTTIVGAGRTISLAAATAGKVIVFDGIGDLSFAPIVSDNVNTASAVTLTASGTLATDGITSRLVTLNAAGNVTQTGPIVSAGTATIDSTAGSITLGNVANALATVVLKNAPTGVTLVESDGVIVGNGTAVTGAATIGTVAGNIALGAASANTVRFDSTLGLTAAGDVTDGSDNITVIGTLTATGANVLLNGGTTTSGRFTALNNQYGQVNITTAGNASVWESTTLNLGTITAGTLEAYSSNGIINTGRLQIAGATAVGAGSAAAPGTVELNYTAAIGSGNTFGGAISVLDDLQTIGVVGSIGNYVAGNIDIRGDTNLAVAIPANLYAQGLTGNIALTTTGTTALTPGALRTTGGVTLTSGTGAITATDGANSFGAVTVNSAGGAVAISSTNSSNVTVNAALTGATASTASYTATAGTLTIGNYASNYTGATTFATSTNKAIQDSVAGVSIFGDVVLASTGGIDVNRTGHNFGGVSISTLNNGSATIRESGTLRLNAVSVHGTGSLTATSTGGSIIQSAGNPAMTVGNTSSSATFTASNGNVTLNSTANNVQARFNLTAGNNVVVDQTRSTILGNVVTPGSLTVTTTGANLAITQHTGTSLNVFDAVNLTATGTGAVTVNNSGNRMGPVSAQTTSGAITLRESPTLNLRAISTTGAFTATSTEGGIIDTTGAVSAGFVNEVNVTGVTSLTAAGDIAITGAANKFDTLALTAMGNASVTDTTGSLILGASTVAGTLDITNTTGNIGQSGALNIGGNTTILATLGTSAITLADSSNRFGGFRFAVGTGGAVINEVTTFNLRSGSIATGPVTIGTGGDFVTSGPGGSSFLGDLSISATGTIIPSTGSMLVVGTFSVFSNATKDLSALSKSGNLTGKDPINVGTGTYVPPSP
jgi:filamentous hemagglutinin family protein